MLQAYAFRSHKTRISEPMVVASNRPIKPEITTENEKPRLKTNVKCYRLRETRQSITKQKCINNINPV